MKPYQLPLLTPDSDWVRPTSLPDLRKRKWLCIDTETHDLGLEANMGPGWARGAGKVLGVSWAADESAGYAPIAHPDSDNFDKATVSRWLKDHVKAGVRLYFQNAPYDLGWIYADLGVDVPIEHPIDDALCAAFMLDENQYTYNLDDICARLGIPGKDETLLKEAAYAYLKPAQAKNKWKPKAKEVKAGMWKIPARYVGAYATQDAVATAEAIHKILPQLEEQEVTNAYRLEMDLAPLCRRMRSRGVKIDEDKAYQSRDNFIDKRDELLAEMKRRLPGRGEIEIEHLRKVSWMERVFSDEKITFPRTEPSKQHPEGQSSFSRDWMAKHPHWLPQMCVKALKYDRFANVFIEDYLFKFIHKGRIHAEAHQYKSDDGGTVSYRFAYSNPPLQQAPSADLDPEVGMAFRELFVADGLWGANDYSQQEYRLTAHFAAATGVRGGAEAAQKFVDDPNLDFHKMVGEMAGIPRGRAKITNFAILYGQGLDATAHNLGMPLEEADALRKLIAEKAPFGPALDEHAKRLAGSRGFLKLLDGARVRFDEWECGWLPREEYARGMREFYKMTPCSIEEALTRQLDPKHPWHGTRLRRAGVRKALNRLIQGSAARQTKLAMRECGREGLIPILQMHDELDHDEDSPEKLRRVQQIMQTVVKLRVPMKVDLGIGKSWAEAKAKG